MDLSIIIVNWNAKEDLQECLKSVYREIKSLSCEVLVVDNASSDGSADMVKKEFPGALLLMNQENVGFAKANNQAIHASTGKYILLLNPDTVVLDGCIIEMVDYMERHQEVGAAGCKILNPQREVEPFKSAKRFPTPFSKFCVDVHLDKLFPRIRIFGRFSMVEWDRTDAREVDALSGACMFVRRTTIEDVGLLDERFFLLAEDVDWCFRIKQKKWKIEFNPKAQIIHTGGKSIDQVKRTRLENDIRSHLLYFKKHQGWLNCLYFRFLASLSSFFKMIYWIYGLLFYKNKKLALNNSISYFRAIVYCLTVSTKCMRR